jgi:hypothetical protein
MTARIATLLAMLLMLTSTMHAQTADPRSLPFMGIPLEGSIDSIDSRLRVAGFTQWGGSEDGEDYYYRGNYYGIRAKLLVTIAPASRLVQSASVTVGPYSTKGMLTRNYQYFLHKLQQAHGTFSNRDGSHYLLSRWGSIKLSQAPHDNGSTDIRVFYYPSQAFYKDAVVMGLRGRVQEVVTENAVAEDQFMHFSEDGQLENPDLIERHYDGFGYLTQAKMTEKMGQSTVEYTYSSSYYLLRRTLTNQEAGITYVNEYVYNQDDEVQSETQKVYDQNNECIMSISLHNNYLTRDDYGNWTSNSLQLTYWEKGSQSQHSTVLQKRTLTYWE